LQHKQEYRFALSSKSNWYEMKGALPKFPEKEKADLKDF
jgi:hypothetical protein